MQYTDGLLANIQDIISGSAGESKQRFDQLFISLQNVYDECSERRGQLQLTPASYDEEVAGQ